MALQDLLAASPAITEAEPRSRAESRRGGTDGRRRMSGGRRSFGRGLTGGCMNTHVASGDARAQLAANVAVPFEQARAMPPAVYTSPAFLEAELARIFRKEWYCIGRASALSRPGDYATCDLAGQPVAVLRDRNGRLAAFSTVCLHRMSTLLEGR